MKEKQVLGAKVLHTPLMKQGTQIFVSHDEIKGFVEVHFLQVDDGDHGTWFLVTPEGDLLGGTAAGVAGEGGEQGGVGWIAIAGRHFHEILGTIICV